jgi:hypothetical protein
MRYTKQIKSLHKIILVFSIVFMSVLTTACKADQVAEPTQIEMEAEGNSFEESANDIEAPIPETDFDARFEIYTKGTKRIFDDFKYHNQSVNVYLEATDPSVVNVKSTGITWDDFFKTLPFSLDKECLLTGTGQKFCTGESGKLQFILNGVEDPDVLDKEIQENDFLEVKFE